MNNPTISRRSLLVASALSSGAALTGGMTACTTGPSVDSNKGSANAKVTLPEYLPVNLTKPDLPGNEDLMSGYYRYPRDPKPVFDTPPASGLGKISILYATFVAAAPRADRNSFYAQLQTDIGAELDITAIPAGAYAAKFQTAVASGDLPDIMGFSLPAPDQPKVMEKLFADLGPYLTGDAAKEYPFLANIPTVSWRPTVANGTIYAVPQPRSVAGAAVYYRKDLFDQLGVNPEPGDYQEFVEMMKAVTDPQKNRWAFSNPMTMLPILQGMQGGPNGWVEEGGAFTSAWGDERVKRAIACVTDMVKQGLFHPGSNSASYTQHRDFFFAGHTVILGDGYAGWDLFVRQLGGGEAGTAKLGLLIAPAFDGGGDGPHLAGTGYQALTVIKKGLGESKTRKLLNVLNFLAAPVGSAEHLRRKFGVAGADFTWVDDLPELTKQGSTNFLDLQYVVDAPTIIGPGVREGVDRQHAWHKRTVANLVRDPSIGLYSDTLSRKGVALNRIMSDVINGIVFGRNSMSDYDVAYRKWRTDGGAAIAAELAKSKEAVGDR